MFPKTILSKMKDIFDAETERNILKSHILTKRDKVAVTGEYGISSSSANPGRSAERWRRLALLRSGDVEPNPGPPRARSRGGQLLTADITAGSVAKFRRALDAFDFYPVVTRAVCYLQMDFSLLSKLSRGTWNGSDEHFSSVPKTLVIALRRVALCAIFLGAPTSASNIHFRALWRLHQF